MMPQTPKVKRKVALPAYSHTQSLSVVAVLTISLSIGEKWGGIQGRFLPFIPRDSYSLFQGQCYFYLILPLGISLDP